MTADKYIYCVNVASIVRCYSNFSQDICDYIACQFALESNFGESNLAVKYNNHSGMRQPLSRPTCSSGSSFGWAAYADLTHCVVDYLFCLLANRLSSAGFKSLPNFKVFIAKFYCPETTYIERINNIYQQFKNFQNGEKK